MESIKRYFQFVRPYWKMIGITILVGILKFGIPLLLPLLLMYVIDELIQAKTLSQGERLNQLVLVMAASFFIFTVIRAPVEYYRQFFAQWVGNKILYDIRARLFEHLQKLSLRYYHNRKAGEIISRVINDVEQTKNFVMTGLMNLWLDFVTLFIAVGIMFYLDARLTLVAIAVFPLYGFAVKYFYQRLRMLTRKRSQALAELQGHLHERVQGMAVTQSFALEEHEQQHFAKYNDHFLDRALTHTSWNAKTFAVINTITDLAPLLVISYGGYLGIQGQLSPGALAAFYGYLERIYGPLRRFVNSSTILTQAIASMDRVFELLDEPYEITDRPGARTARNIKGEVSFEQVSFRYHEDSPYVLKNINLHVQAGETVALVGMSGGGKSTLISLLPRFYDVTAGSIRLDGVDIRDYQLRSLREQIGMVLQDSILFSDSVRENIMMGNPQASEEEMVQAAKAANAHEFIMELPHGYDTEIGERGVKLSGGQKQRIALARLFLKNPPVLVLDEATSALDLESERMIQEAIEKLAKNRTTFIVAHRLSTIAHADRIVVIENGEIVEEGTHESLMTKQGTYYRLYQIQELEH
ncbi:putative multidrug export ATP-binding/permease protein YgaD [Caldalkalibacillus thermarum]|uniref:ABC transporter ATP-binding protein n=1 Tax=Caldalkalibacillus thermarum TaxID=296745 RepID=UPI00199F2013|nr:ABC transporter ATP-binding protein [Caldalkalibacillus thermarum]GGK28136.1 putative multidrug export ATP-binding/permease protein YgaD [Caldalkalibacillus thermarum]